ncbi:dihydrofolate reductase family protein [Nocardia sp. NPDC020380]|uniref:dihydrofolate reductase family protein n=1 Tax=Nocardia sp. NPDC020380 TaxID=3364309 RepID=UPI0037983C3F
MGRIIVSANVSIDGVIQDPNGDEGLVPGGWFDFGGIEAQREAWSNVLFEEAQGAEAMLMGRRSYEFFAARWPQRTGAYADRLNGLPKYVVSATLEHADWNNSTIVKSDVVEEVSKLKQNLDGEIVVYASGGLVPTLLARDLVDEVRLLVFPLVIGSGTRLFGDGGPKSLRRHEIRSVGDAITLLIYRFD